MDFALQVRRNAEEQQKSLQELKKFSAENFGSDKQREYPPIRRRAKPARNSEINIAEALDEADYQPMKQQVQEDHREESLVEKEKGNAYFKRRDYKKAIHCYSKSFQLDKNAISMVNRALCHLKLEKYADAEQDCTIALGLDIKCTKALWRRGKARTELGKLSDACADLEHALVLEPTNVQIKQDLNHVRELVKKQAISLIRKKKWSRLKKSCLVDADWLSLKLAIQSLKSRLLRMLDSRCQILW